MDKEDFAARVTSAQGSLYRIACSYLACEHDRLDAISEAIFKAWQKRDTLRAERYFDTWLVRILIRSEQMNSGARQIVEYPQASKRVGDAAVTVQEAVWDGFVGHLVIEYRSPEGTAMVPWDDRRIEGKAETEEELLAQYGAFYCPVDPGMSFLTEGAAQEIGEMSFMYYQEADNVLSMILTFGEEELKSSELRFKAGVFKFDREVEGEKEKQFIDFELADHASENRAFTFEHPGELNGKAIDRVVFTFTPMQTVVDIDFADGSRTYTGMDVLVLDEAGNAVMPTSPSLWTNGVDAFEELPRKLSLQAATNGEPVGEPLALTFE